QDGQLTDVTSVNIGPIKVGRTPPGLTINVARPQNPSNHLFGDAPNLTLLGYDLTDQSGQLVSSRSAPVPQLNLTLYWRCESPPSLDYTTFAQMRNTDGEIIAQKDQPPLAG